MPSIGPTMRRTLRAWNALRARAALHRGVWIAAPVFWAAFAVFIHPAWGCAGFVLHAALCLPRHATARIVLLLAFPLSALWFATREPFGTLPSIPFHRTFPESPAIASTHRESESFTGIVEAIPVANARGYVFLFRVRSLDGSPQLYRANLTLMPNGAPPRWGTRIRLYGTAGPGRPALNPGQLDMTRVLRAQGAAALIEATAWKELDPPPPWKFALLHARAALNESLQRHVPRPTLPLLEASLLNITANVPEETQTAFLRSGMQHILAISGQHIGLLLAFLLFAGLSVRMPRKAAFVLAAALTAAYIPLVGSPVSVVRSGIMLACVLPALLLERKTAGLHALCLTAATDLLFDPHNILNLGFQLSYAATLALILCARPAGRIVTHMTGRVPIPTWGQGVLQMFLLSGCVSLCTYPVLAASTHATTPWGILGNAVTVPVGGAMLVGGLCTWSFDFLGMAADPFSLFSTLANFAGAATGACALLLEACVFFLADLPGALVPVADACTLWIALLCAGCAAVLLLLRRERLRLAVLCAGILIAVETARPAINRLWDAGHHGARITFLAVGHGDAAVLELPGAVIGIDAGDSPRIARNVIVPFLQARGIARLDLLLITHPDRDHYGGAAALIERIPVGAVIGPPEPQESSPTWNCLRTTARGRGVPWHEGRAGQRVYASLRVALRMLGPDSTLAGADKNNRSLVALLQTPEGNVLFTGDIEQPGQQALTATWPLWRGAWLKAPHHGSDRTTDPCFLKAVAPRRTVVSCGSRRGFPGPRTMATLAATGSNAAITKRDGAVTWILGRRGSREYRHLPN